MYAMSYFKTEHEAMYLAISEDGFAWSPLRDGEVILESEVGDLSVRDPHISRDHNGTFHLYFTDGWCSDCIVHSTSRDLLSWSPQELLPVMRSVTGTQNCWAPECFFDHDYSLYRIIWSSTVKRGMNFDDIPERDHRIWGTATTDFVTYQTPSIFFDPGYSVIDANIVWHEGSYLMAFKDERGDNRPDSPHKAIQLSRAAHARGPYTQLSSFVTPALTEGPTLFRRNGEWVMFFDHFDEAKFGAITSRDGYTWNDASDRVQFPPGPRHGSVLEVPDDIAYILRGEL